MTDTIEPIEVIAGDTLAWIHTDGEREAPTWTLTYSFLAKGCARIEITATDNGDGSHSVAVDAATTVDWEAGEYHWQRHLTNGTERKTTGSGWLTVKPDYATGNVDPRSSAKRTLDTLEAVRENKATGDQLSMSIGGRSISRMTWAEINEAYNHFKAIVDSENAKELSERGIADQSGRIKVAFENA